MSMKEFIKLNREDIDEVIRQAIDQPSAKFNNTEREEWILNDMMLYDWARSEGVKI